MDADTQTTSLPSPASPIVESPPEIDPALGSPHHRNAVWRIVQFFCRILFYTWFGFRTRGMERLPAGGGLILSNHQSFLDPLLVGVYLNRPISFLAREDLFKAPVVGWILARTYVMPLNRAASTTGLRETIRRMKLGFLVGVFPEGTRTPDGVVREVKPGFTALLRRSDLPIIPVGIAGAHRAFGLGHRIPKPYRIRLVYGEPIPPEIVAELKGRGREDELVALVHKRIVECQMEAEAWIQGRALEAQGKPRIEPGK